MSEHTKLFIRRSEARALLGVSEEVFTGLVGAHSLEPVYLHRPCRKCKGRFCRRCGGTGTMKGRAFFMAAEVEALADRGGKAKP